MPGSGAPANPPDHSGLPGSPIPVDPGPGAGGQPPQGHEPPPGVVVEGVAGLVGGQVGPVQGPLGPPAGGLAAAGGGPPGAGGARTPRQRPGDLVAPGVFDPDPPVLDHVDPPEPGLASAP